LGASAVAEAPPAPVRRNYPSRQRRRRRVIQWGAFAVVATIAALFLRASIFEPFSVPTTSMVPTLQVGDQILVVKPSLLRGRIKTGDVVVLRQPKACSPGNNQSQDLVKRVIGLPGQTIWSTYDTIYINGQILREAGWYNPPFGQLGPTLIARTKIPPGSYFVMGDNRTDTCDSRSFGPVPGSSIVGKVVAITLRYGHPHVHFF
jgi:signal peptidase I